MNKEYNALMVKFYECKTRSRFIYRVEARNKFPTLYKNVDFKYSNLDYPYLVERYSVLGKPHYIINAKYRFPERFNRNDFVLKLKKKKKTYEEYLDLYRKIGDAKQHAPQFRYNLRHVVKSKYPDRYNEKDFTVCSQGRKKNIDTT